jgi:ribosomal protein S12 methylthiotransferase
MAIRTHSNPSLNDVRPVRYLMVTLGCFRNEVEADLVRSALGEQGLVETGDVSMADVLIVMTCGFIREACDEGIDTILELHELASRTPERPPIVVLGCMSQRYGGALAREMPEISAVLGAEWPEELPVALASVLGGRKYVSGPRPPRMSTVRRSTDSSEGATLFVRVADGCDRACGFCTIPSIRGPFVSRPEEEVAEEVERLASGRPREVVLLAQDLTSYGAGLPAPAPDLAALVHRLTGAAGVHWLRLLYLQPEGVTEHLIEEVAANPVICDYFDIPFQHSSPRVLRGMGRPGSGEEYLGLISRIRDAIPRAALRSTVMVGYPGESEQDFEDLIAFVREAKFDWLGAFIFSGEEGTKAAALAGTVEADEALSRYNMVVEVQDGVEAERLERMVGLELEVVVDELCELEPYEAMGRSYREAPVVDGEIYLKRTARRASVEPGEFVPAVITGHEGLDLVGEI